MIYVKICYLLATSILIFKEVYFLLLILQQEHYNVKKFMKVLNTYYFNRRISYCLYIIILIAMLNNIYLYPIGMLIVLISLFIKEKYILKLIITKRIIRLFITLSILFMLLLILIPYKVFYILLLLIPFIVILSNFINKPIEYFIRKYYLNKAKRKLSSCDKLIKIGITGSYGKTSTKNILNYVLEDNYICLKTPSSFNTLMGLSKVVNKSLNKSTELFICEMGAYRLNEIKEIANFIKPSVGIITDIGYQHMETFKTINNVTKAKFELINSLKQNDIAILNGDNEFIKNKSVNINNVCYYGLEKTNDVYATKIVVVNGVTKFDIYYQDKFIDHFETKLLGKHNIKNILCAFATIQMLKKIYNLDISYKDFKEKIKKAEPTSHRLSYKKINNIHLYDDSYNSNLVGFENGIEVIKNTPYEKILITPGIVDTGKLTKQINSDISKKIKNIFNEIYIIDNYSGRFIYDELKETEHINLFTSFSDAYNKILEKYKDKEISLLIENDLPDNYLTRRKQ